MRRYLNPSFCPIALKKASFTGMSLKSSSYSVLFWVKADIKSKYWMESPPGNRFPFTFKTFKLLFVLRAPASAAKLCARRPQSVKIRVYVDLFLKKPSRAMCQLPMLVLVASKYSRVFESPMAVFRFSIM